MWETVSAFFAEYAFELSGSAALIAIIETVFKPFRKLFGRTETVKLDQATTEALAPVQAKQVTALTTAEFIRLRRELKADLMEEFAAAPDAEKDQLRARIAELESQIANPDEAFAEMQKRVQELEALLERSGNQIGGDRLAEARAALEQGDYSIADDLFAEIEERRRLEVAEAARAAFGRGEIAEAEVRWADAARHYGRAVDLEEEPVFETLFKAREFAWRAGDFDASFRFGAQLLAMSRGVDEPKKLAAALNEHALTLRAQGRYEEAEGLYREALEILNDKLGGGHPNTLQGQKNLEMLLAAMAKGDVG